MMRQRQHICAATDKRRIALAPRRRFHTQTAGFYVNIFYPQWHIQRAA